MRVDESAAEAAAADDEAADAEAADAEAADAAKVEGAGSASGCGMLNVEKGRAIHAWC